MIIVKIWQGLGNQLFQYSFAKILQLETGKEVLIDTSNMYSNDYGWKVTERKIGITNFEISLKSADKELDRFFFLGKKNFYERTIYWLSINRVYKYFLVNNINIESIELNDIKDNSYIIGNLQYKDLIEKYRDVLLNEFEPVNKIKIYEKFVKLDNTVAVHIRRGDFRKYDRELPKTYYVEAFKYIEAYIKNPRYIVFSDDIEWVKKNIHFTHDYEYIENYGLEDYEELILMSKCKHNIIANSTFSWWAAWLNRNESKIVIAPQKHWFPDQKNILPDNWIKI